MSDPARREVKTIFSAGTERVVRRGWFWRRVEIIDVPNEWRVEECDADGDSGVAVAIFTGPHAEPRARHYTEQLRAGMADGLAVRAADE
jgi:hypothetical protein